MIIAKCMKMIKKKTTNLEEFHKFIESSKLKVL